MKDIWMITVGFTFIFLMTSLGSSIVFFFRKKEIGKKFHQVFLGFAGGIMVAASIFSLLIPSLEYESHLPIPSIAISAISFLLGCLLLFVLDKIIPHLHGNQEQEGIQTNRISKNTKMFLAVTIHNIPEGLSVGVAFGVAFAMKSDAMMLSALMLAIGIGIQNFPEGAAVSLPLKDQMKSSKKAFLYGAFSGLVEPIAAIFGFLLASNIIGIMPWALAFSSGAMIYVVVEDIIPESQFESSNHLATFSFIFGFLLMMILDVAVAF